MRRPDAGSKASVNREVPPEGSNGKSPECHQQSGASRDAHFRWGDPCPRPSIERGASRQTRRIDSSDNGHPIGRFATGALLLLSTMAFLLRSAYPGLAEAATVASVLISIPVLAHHWSQIASRWAAIIILGLVSLAWTQNDGLSLVALLSYIAVGLPALAAGAILRLSEIAFILSVGFLGSALTIRDGILFNPNTHAKLTLLGLIALSAFLQGSRHPLWRLLAPIPLILALPMTVAAASTQVAIAWGVAVLIWVFWRVLKQKWDKHPVLMVAATLVALPALAYFSQVSSLFWGSSAAEATIETGRLDLWRALWSTCEKDLCGLGTGMGTITDVTERISIGPSLAHNMFMLLLVELGVLGVFLVVRLLMSIIGSVAQLEQSGFPALVFASLTWTMSSDLLNMADFYVVSLWLAVGSCVQTTSLRGFQQRLTSGQSNAHLEKGSQ